ncbi:MAG: hypothetical protein JWR28_3449 [Modestobacter sp.]|nr:hypothetical protein [Modestobacter sp.]
MESSGRRRSAAIRLEAVGSSGRCAPDVDRRSSSGRTRSCGRRGGVDTAAPVTGSTPAIDVTQYDLAGNPTFTLTAADRATVMGQDDPAAVAAGGQTASQIWSALALPTTAVPADLTAAPDGDSTLGSVRFRPALWAR